MKVEQYLTKLEKLSAKARISRSGAVSVQTVRAFQSIVIGFYHHHGRRFAWRTTRDPYRILVSEIMLQQTQTARVAERYREFLRLFPSVQALAEAPQAAVLRAWQGLGYYRRARNLHRAAISICELHRGKVPRDRAQLQALPGVGAYTAGAVAVFAFNAAVPMIETNIRSVFLFTFCRGRRKVADTELLRLIDTTLLGTDSRKWFYALMDLGVELKRLQPGINRASKHHSAQPPFKGSDREVAAQVLKLVVSRKRPVQERELRRIISAEPIQISKALQRLLADKLLKRPKPGLLSPV